MSDVDFSECLEKARSSIPRCLGVCLVQLSTGQLLAQAALGELSEDAICLSAARAHDLFLGPATVALGDFLGRLFEQQQNPEEMLSRDGSYTYIYRRRGSSDDQVLLAVCRRDVNLGMAVSQSRLQFGQLALD